MKNYCAVILYGLSLLSLTACESWFGPAEGDGIRGVTASTIEIVSDRCCGATVRLNNGPEIRIRGSHSFSNLEAGTYRIAIRECWGSCGGGILDDGGCHCERWTYCTVDLPQGGYRLIEAGECRT